MVSEPATLTIIAKAVTLTMKPLSTIKEARFLLPQNRLLLITILSISSVEFRGKNRKSFLYSLSISAEEQAQRAFLDSLKYFAQCSNGICTGDCGRALVPTGENRPALHKGMNSRLLTYASWQSRAGYKREVKEDYIHERRSMLFELSLAPFRCE